jgi:probable O-glycosylation ligase (exosortase A-associated)
MLACLGYLNPQRLCYTFAYDFPFYKITVIVTLAAALISRGRMKVPWTVETLLLVAFSIWMCFTTLFAIDPTAIDEWNKAIRIQIGMFMTLILIRNPIHLRWLIWVIALSLGFYGVKGGLFTILTGGGHHVLGPDDSFLADNNALALALTMMIPLLRFIQLNVDVRWIRWALAGAMALTSAAILGTYSRGGFIALTTTCLLLAVMSRRRLALVTIGIVVILAAVSFMPAKWSERMQTIENYDDDRSVLGRFMAWNFALKVAADRPLTGAGFYAFHRIVYDRYFPQVVKPRDAHSIYFKVLAEHGYPGLALFLGLWLSAIISANTIKRAARGHNDLAWATDLATMAQISLIAYAVGGAALGMCYFDLPYHVVTFIILTKVFVKQNLLEKNVEAQQTGTENRWHHPAAAVPA